MARQWKWMVEQRFDGKRSFKILTEQMSWRLKCAGKQVETKATRKTSTWNEKSVWNVIQSRHKFLMELKFSLRIGCGSLRSCFFLACSHSLFSLFCFSFSFPLCDSGSIPLSYTKRNKLLPKSRNFPTKTEEKQKNNEGKKIQWKKAPRR